MPLQPRKTPAERAAAVAKFKTTRGTIPDRYAAFVKGELTIEDLDEEELMRGQIRGKDGSFRGRPPRLVPREFAQGLAAAQHNHMARRIAGLVDKAFKTLEEVMDKQHPQPGDAARVKAAQLLIERYLGRVPETVNIKAEVSTWNSNKEKFVKTVHIGELKQIEKGQDDAAASEPDA